MGPVVVTVDHPPPELSRLSILKPVSLPLLSVQARLIWVWETGVAPSPVGAAGGFGSVVAVAVFEDRTSEPSLSQVGRIAADRIAEGLKATGLVEVAASGAMLLLSENRAGVPWEEVARATRAGLIVTGGSDFHQPLAGGIVMGAGRGNLKIPYRCVEEIRAVISFV